MSLSASPQKASTQCKSSRPDLGESTILRGSAQSGARTFRREKLFRLRTLPSASAELLRRAGSAFASRVGAIHRTDLETRPLKLPQRSGDDLRAAICDTPRHDALDISCVVRRNRPVALWVWAARHAAAADLGAFFRQSVRCDAADVRGAGRVVPD